MFEWSLPSVVCRRAHVVLTLFVLVCFSSSSCVACVASFPGLSIFDCPFGIRFNVYLMVFISFEFNMI